MIDEKILGYIRTSLAEGKTKEELYKEFLAQGRTIEAIQEDFAALDAETGAEPERQPEDTSKKTIRLIVTIGVVLIAAGIFSFIASNWQGMSKTAKVMIILISMLASYGGGWYLKEVRNLERTGAALFLLGSLIYGAGIFLVAQIFNIQANWPDGFLLWMLGVIAVAFAINSFAHFYLAFVLGLVAIIWHPFLIFAGRLNPFLLASSFLLFISMAAAFITGWILYRRAPSESRKFY